MKCFICDTDAIFYFKKTFDNNPVLKDDVEYLICPKCGFVFSKTHAEMDKKQWECLNIKGHMEIESATLKRRKNNQPPYLEQATMINLLIRNNIIDEKGILDWGAGIGTLSNISNKYYNIDILTYDKYMNSNKIIENRKYETVISSAVFEHVTNRNILDEINSYVEEDGCLILHTVIAENVPKDPKWFYLLPIHCAFHTNKSMEILMRQWGYISSIYCPSSKCWILFKKEKINIEECIYKINEELQREYFIYKKGFVDYWK